jgi:nitroreductase
MSSAPSSTGDIALVGVSSLQLDASIEPLSLALMDTLGRRRSGREFSAAPLALPQLSRLLWSAYGCNRAAARQRTAPTPGDAEAIGLYVGLSDGVFRFDGEGMRLVRVCGRDIRADTSAQPCVSTAYAALVYVADLDRMTTIAEADRALTAALWIGHLSQNVYLFCAAEGLATFAHTGFDRAALGQAIGLGAGQQVMLAQAVGHPVVAQARAQFPDD